MAVNPPERRPTQPSGGVARKGAEASLSNLSFAVVFIRLPEFREEFSRNLRVPN